MYHIKDLIRYIEERLDPLIQDFGHGRYDAVRIPQTKCAELFSEWQNEMGDVICESDFVNGMQIIKNLICSGRSVDLIHKYCGLYLTQ